MINFDIILERMGGLGWHQISVIILVNWLAMHSGQHNVASVFYGARTAFQCNTTFNGSGYNSTNSISMSTNAGCFRNEYKPSRCQNSSLQCHDESIDITPCNTGYWFDTTVFKSTVNMEWNLVCDRKFLGTTATSIYFSGVLTGSLLFGWLSDFVGRRYTMLIGAIGTVLCGVGVSFFSSFEMFVVFRFLVGAMSVGGYITMFTYVMEISGKAKTVVGIHTHTSFSLGILFNSLFSYIWRDWRQFYFFMSLTPVPYFFIHFLVPESPRWYFSRGKNDEGMKTAQLFATRKNITLTEKDWDDAKLREVGKPIEDRNYSWLDLFKPRRMRIITLQCVYAWLVIAVVYYGLSLNAGSLAGDIFLNNALNACLDIVGYVIAQLFMDRLGRRYILASVFIVQGTSCIISTILKELSTQVKGMTTVGVAVAFVGKVAVASGFAIIYNVTAELFPTVVRGNAMGFGSMSARLGGMAAPYIILLQDSVSWGPNVIFGVMSIAACYFSLQLPETTGITMMQTIEEAESFYTSSSRCKMERNLKIDEKSQEQTKTEDENEDLIVRNETKIV